MADPRPTLPPTGPLEGTRILVVLPSIPVQGMERATLQILRMMGERGADALFVTHRRYGQRVWREVEQIGFHYATAPFEQRLRLPRSLRDLVQVGGAWARTAADIARIYREYRPTHVYLTDLGAFFYALPVVWLTRQPVVFRLPNPPAVGLPPRKQAISNWLWRTCVARVADVIVCNSRYSASLLAAIGVQARSLRVIHNCLPQRPAPAASDAPAVDRSRVNVLYLGRIRPEKGVRHLVDAARRIIRERDDVDFHLVGDHTWKNPFADGLLAELEAAGVTHRIRVVDEIQDVGSMLDRCDLHVCPSVSAGESFPNVLLEAKSRGVASVAFPTAGIPEAITHLVDGYLCPEPTTEALYQGLRYFLDRPEARARAGQAARESLTRFAPDAIGDQWETVFRTAARRRGTQARLQEASIAA